MIILEFEGQTRVLAPPAGWNQESGVQCGSLPIIEAEMQGRPCMVSFWKPTAEELAQLNEGSHIQLAIFGRVHPPVSLCVHKCDAVIERAPKVAP